MNRGEMENAKAYSEEAGELVRRYKVESAEFDWLSERIAAEERRQPLRSHILRRQRDQLARGCAGM